MIDTATASRLCDVSISYYLRCLQSLGIRARKGKRSLWGRRHVLAVMLIPVMHRQKVSSESAVALARRIVSGSDEQLEAALLEGRSWVVMAGANAMPELLPFGAIEHISRERADALAQLGLALTGVDLAELWSDIVRVTTPDEVTSRLTD